MKFAGILVKRGTMLVFLLSAFLGTFQVAPAFAQSTNYTTGGPDLGTEYPAYSGMSNVDPRVTAARIIRVAMSLLGIVFVGLVLYGGFTWMTAGGNSEQVDKAKKFISSGVIGLAIILAAYSITYFVTNALIQATAGDPGTSSSY